MTKDELRSQKRDLSHVVLSSFDFEDNEVLLAFHPMKSEVDINPVVEKAIKAGLVVAFPEKEPGLYKTSDEKILSVADIKQKTIMLVPGLSFTKEGKRLGRGGGWYDRTISMCPSTVKTIGVCKKSQILPSLPTEDHDMSVEELIIV